MGGSDSEDKHWVGTRHSQWYLSHGLTTSRQVATFSIPSTLPSPARKRAQEHTTIQHSPRKLKIDRPAVLKPSLSRHLHPLSGQKIHHPRKEFKRRLHLSQSARSTQPLPKSPLHQSPIAQATIPTAMLLQLAIPRHRSLSVHGTSVSPLPQTAGKPFPISTDPILPRPRVEAWTKLRRKSPPRQVAKIQPSPPTVIAAAAAPSTSATQAIKVTVPST